MTQGEWNEINKTLPAPSEEMKLAARDSLRLLRACAKYELSAKSVSAWALAEYMPTLNETAERIAGAMERIADALDRKNEEHGTAGADAIARAAGTACLAKDWKKRIEGNGKEAGRIAVDDFDEGTSAADIIRTLVQESLNDMDASDDVIMDALKDSFLETDDVVSSAVCSAASTILLHDKKK